MIASLIDLVQPGIINIVIIPVKVDFERVSIKDLLPSYR